MAKKGREYFTKDTENAIVKYSNSEDLKEREYLYKTYIDEVFSELVSKVVYTYKFGHLPDLESHKEDCKLYLVSILKNFDPDKGSKAFSYFTIVTKNWFSYRAKKETKRRNTEIDISEIHSEEHLEKISVYNKYVEKREEREFWATLLVELSSWKAISKGNDYRVLEAIEIILANANEIDIFNKKAVYLYMREITGLNTKQITNSLKKIKQRYFLFRNKWSGGEI
jgi:hypothetical protein